MHSLEFGEIPLDVVELAVGMRVDLRKDYPRQLDSLTIGLRRL